MLFLHVQRVCQLILSNKISTLVMWLGAIYLVIIIIREGKREDMWKNLPIIGQELTFCLGICDDYSL